MIEPPTKILVIDDESDILDFIGYNLKKEGYKVYTLQDSRKAIELAIQTKPDLIILDIMMPGIDGVELCKEIRDQEIFNNTLIVFLTARNEDYSEIAAFEVGADDYITKPIRPRVLLARIKAILKRKNRDTASLELIKIGELIIDPNNRSVVLDEQEIPMPKKEFNLLLLFASKPGKIFTRDEIYFNIWGNSVHVGDRTLDVHIRKLREKIGNHYIRTSKGTGYGIEF